MTNRLSTWRPYPNIERLYQLKLSILKPILSSAQSQQKKKNRRYAEPLRECYNTQRWKDLRDEVLLRDKYVCQWCGELILNPAKQIAHHKIPHKGDERLFWSKDNLITVCKPCHDGPIAREERNDNIWGTWD